MGCDIHAYIEVQNEDGEWVHYDWRKKHQIGTYEDGSPEYDYDKYFNDPLYIRRNYDLFAILADVRNGRGFAGIETGMGFVPISQPRGLPEDVSEEIQQESDSWGIDGHSHSWLTLHEMLTFDYELTTVHYGVIDVEEYKTFKEKGSPNSWSGDVSGSRVRKVTNAEMDEIIAGASELDKTFSYYTRVSWTETYEKSVGKAWFETLREMRKLGDHDKVRLVFWFDN